MFEKKEISNGVNIRLANKKDCQQIAEIHFSEIKYGFLNQLGKKFLSYFYMAMITSPNAFLVVAEEDDGVIGFISGCTNLNKFYKDFVKQYTFKSFLILLKKIFSFSIFKKVFEVMSYSKKEEKGEDSLPLAELLSIAISGSYQGQGIAQKLLEKFVLEMKTREIDKFRVIVGENLPQANKFYLKSGFIFHSKNSVHKDTPSNIYIYIIEKSGELR